MGAIYILFVVPSSVSACCRGIYSDVKLCIYDLVHYGGTDMVNVGITGW